MLHNVLFFQEEQAGVELRHRYMNMRSNSQDRGSDTRSIKAA